MALRSSLVDALSSARSAVDGGQSAPQREWLPDKTWESMSCRTVTEDTNEIVVEVTVDAAVADLLSVPLPASRVARVRHRVASAACDPITTPLLVRVPFAGTVDAVVVAIWSHTSRLRQQSMLPVVPNPQSCYARGTATPAEAADLLLGDLHVYVANASGAPGTVPIRRYKAGAGGAAASVLSLDSARLHAGMIPPPASGVPFKQRLAKLGQRGLPPVRLHVGIPQGILELRRHVAAEAEGRMRLQGSYLLHASGIQLQQEQWRACQRARGCIIALQAKDRHALHTEFDRRRFDAEVSAAQREERVARQRIVNDFFTIALPQAFAGREQLEFVAVTSAVLRSILADEDAAWLDTMKRFVRRRGTIVRKHGDGAAFGVLVQRTNMAFNEHQRSVSLLFAKAVESLSARAHVL